MSCCLQRAAHFCALGAHYFVIGDVYQSHGAYKRALETLQHAYNEDLNADDDKPMHAARCGTCLPMVAVPFDCDRHGDEEKFEKVIDDEDKSCYFVYTKPFCFDVETVDSSCTPVYIAIAMFGVTLLLMRKARTEPHNLSLYKAFKLYNMALTILKCAPRHLETTNLLIALLNNKAYVCYCIHHFEDAHATLEELSGVLPEVCINEDSMFEENELTGMILNSFLPFELNRLAPAA